MTGSSFPGGISPSARCSNFHDAIRNLVRTAEAWQQTGREVTYLNIVDPQFYGFRPPAHLVEAVTGALRDGFTGYAHSAGLLEARQAVAEFATSMGAPTQPTDVLMTSGATEAAELLLTALLNPGDEVLLPAVGYPIYPALLSKLGALACYYDLREAEGWQPCPEDIKELIGPRTRALVLVNPSNPTGAIMRDDLTRRFLEIAAEQNLLVIADEVYRELCFDHAPTASSVLAQSTGTALVTLESMSKTYLVPGWRVGWMRFTNREQMEGLIAAVGRLADDRLCAPTPSQYAVKPALTGDHAFRDEFLTELKKRRDYALMRISNNERLSAFTPQSAFYMMIKVDDPRSTRTDLALVLDLLEETQALVVPGSGFGADPSESYFGLVYLADEPILARFFDGLDNLISR